MVCYPPSEDTFLLLESLEQEKGGLVIDLGTGSGYVAFSLRDRFDLILATDVSMECLNLVKSKIRESGAFNIEVICCDLLSAIRPCCIDLIVFNPPYLPKDDFETDLDSALIYEQNNRNIINDFIKEIKRFKTKCYIILSSLSNIQQNFEEFKYEVVKKKKLFFEELLVLKFQTF